MANRILVVDDDMMCLKTIQRYLTEEQYEVLAALSGMQAIHIIEETTVDLLLLDIEMPVMSGFAALEQIRALPAGRHLPVIFFTGRQDRDTIKRCAAIGAEGYITKPVERANLIGQVKAVLAASPMQQDEQTVLIADHDLEFLKKAKLSLKKAYKVIVVNTGKSAVDYLTGHAAAVVVLDDTMPELDGIPLREAISRTPYGVQAAVILTGEQEHTTDKTTGKERSEAAYLKRPVSMEVLVQAVQHQIEGC